ncbi:MAG TPA: carboxypeptidase-like regulatory domain-containing protein, partial [Micropepsaceae bacterium]
MNIKRAALLGSMALTLASLVTALPSSVRAAPAPDRIAIDNDDIGGVVRNPSGQPEAGVWVIAETRDLAVRFIKIVVTDDQGRFVVPDLPQANYQVWARGYGLVDSAKITSTPGKIVDIAAVPAPNDAAAAKYYPAIYWYSMMKIPGKELFGGKDPNIPARLTQQGYLNSMKNNGCVGCHQLGQLSTRTIPTLFHEEQSNYADMWLRRIQSGQGGMPMIQVGAGDLGGAAFKYLGDWSQRVEKGEIPSNKPQRPQGVERNIVVTLRDWMNEKQYLHDLISTDRRNPTVNGYGPLFGSPEYSSNDMPILDPVKNTATVFRMTVREDAPLALGPGHVAGLTPLLPSNYWGEESIWDTRVNNHNSMIGRDGRVWLAATFRKPDNPAFCKAGSDHPSAKVFPIARNVRSITVFNPKTKEYRWIDTCFGTHHLQFAYDKNDTLWASGGGPVVGWLNTKMYDETGDAAKSQGWTPLILDTNGNGKRDAGWVEPNQPVDPTKDKRIVASFYAVMPNPVDGSIWGTYRGNPGAIVRIEPGSNPSETAL